MHPGPPRPESIRGRTILYSILLPRCRHCGCIPQSLRWRDPRTGEAQPRTQATSSEENRRPKRRGPSGAIRAPLTMGRLCRTFREEYLFGHWCSPSGALNPIPAPVEGPRDPARAISLWKPHTRAGFSLANQPTRLTRGRGRLERSLAGIVCLYARLRVRYSPFITKTFGGRVLRPKGGKR